MPRHILSKSTFLRGCQCPKSLWLYKHKYDERDEEDSGTSAIFSQGIEVGQLAQEMFPGGIDVSPESYFDFQKSVAETNRLIAEGQKVIYEAAFQYKAVLVAVDILVYKGGKWYAYEVKSSTKVKEVFRLDASIQYHVMINCGIELTDISIIYINNQYIRNGPLNLKELFNIESVLDDVMERQNDVAAKVIELKDVVKAENEPLVEMGRQCYNPYACDYLRYCTEQLEVEDDDAETELVIDKKEIKSFLSELKYPLCYVDFETYTVAVPEHDGHWPYRQIPFQFSLHIESASGKTLKHHQYIAEPGSNPNKEFIETLLSNIGSKGSIIVYNKTFENTRLNELKNEFPEYYDQIENIQSRIIDLMVPFRKGHYKDPKMNGSYSIKAVLPALIPDLSYDNLNISNGGDASVTYYNLKDETNNEIKEQTMIDLFEYCKLDTMAMVEILHKLKSVL